MSLEPPPFQESARCDVCKCSFNTFRRRHHCRRCGRTLCNEHSSNQMALPQFGIHSLVRVCAVCYNDSTRSGKDNPQASSDGVDRVTDTVSKLGMDGDEDLMAGPPAEHGSVSVTSECKCRMPLCICEAPAPSTNALHQQKIRPASTVTPLMNPKPKNADTILRNRGATSNKSSSVSNVVLNKPQMDYESNGEGLREAIKNGDTAAVKRLLSEGVDANYRDKQGLSLLHLAALFNQTDIVFILMECGASMNYKNAQGETPLDCAPVTLQYKMRKKVEEGEAMHEHV